MALEIEKKFVVGAGPDAVWAFLTDPHRVAGCLPGASITGNLDEATYTGTMTVKVGPVATSYNGRVRFERLDAAERSAEIVASGQDVRGRGGADMRMKSSLVEISPGETEVTVVSRVSVTGILAQFGRGMIRDVSDQIFEKFTDAMRVELASESGAPRGGQSSAAPSESEPIEIVSFGARVAGRALGRAMRRPGFWVVVLVLILLAYWLWPR